jgi:ATP-dependent DNA ligase
MTPVLASYTPMVPTQIREPFHRDGWVYEEKVDGWRMLVYEDGRRVRLVSRHGAITRGASPHRRGGRPPTAGS